MALAHLGMSGLRLTLGGVPLCIDPPAPGPEPAVVTWSEAERVRGAAGRSLAALPSVLGWLGQDGTALRLGQSVCFADATVLAVSYVPIPYATPQEALRKTMIGLRHPRLAARRLSHTLRRPPAPPVALLITRGGFRVGVLGQALHRFLSATDEAALVARFSGCDLLIASPDFDDEEACGTLLSRIPAKVPVLADQIGPVRRHLGLPTRPLNTSMRWAPPDTLLLPEHSSLPSNLWSA